MTLFKRTEGTLEELDKVLSSLQHDACADVVDKVCAACTMPTAFACCAGKGA